MPWEEPAESWQVPAESDPSKAAPRGGDGGRLLGATPSPPAPQGAALMPPVRPPAAAGEPRPPTCLCQCRARGGEEAGAAPRPPPRTSPATAPRKPPGGAAAAASVALTHGRGARLRLGSARRAALPRFASGLVAASVRRAAHPAAQAGSRSGWPPLQARLGSVRLVPSRGRPGPPRLPAAAPLSSRRLRARRLDCSPALLTLRRRATPRPAPRGREAGLGAKATPARGRG